MLIRHKLGDGLDIDTMFFFRLWFESCYLYVLPTPINTTICQNQPVSKLLSASVPGHTGMFVDIDVDLYFQ